MNKRLTWIFAVFVVVAVIVIISGIMFTIGDITVQTATDTQLSPEQKSQIIIDSGIMPKSSIFGIDTAIATSNIEQRNPAIRVISVVRKEPNRVFINVTTRTAIMAIPMENEQVALIDRDTKIVGIVPKDQDVGVITKVNGIVLSESIKEGQILPNSYAWLKNLAYGGFESSFVDLRFCYFVQDITIDSQKTSDNVIVSTNSGVKLVLANQDTGVLFKNAYYCYSEVITDSQRKSGYIYLGSDGWKWSSELITK